jgi:hypothetical protein
MGGPEKFTAAIILCSLAAILLLTLVGCSSLNVVDTWHKPAKQGRLYKKIMILGVANDENRRRTFENIVAEELGRGMVTVVPSHTLLPDLDKTNREGVVAAVRAAGCDAVLTTRVLSVGDSTVTQQGQGGDVYGVDPGGNRGNYLKARLQASMYDAATQELVWSSTIKTFDAEKEARMSRELGRFFLDSLRRDGLI